MPLFFQVLASGSKGNSTLVCSPRTSILLDAGMNGKEISRRLTKTPVSADKIDAVVLSHEHWDHVSGVGVFARRFSPPVHLSRGTMDNLPEKVGKLPHVDIFQPGREFAIGDLRVTPFATSHDAGESCGFIIEHEGIRIGVCTDLGVATQLVRTRLQGCRALVLEANHDVERLITGPYPWYLKQRIQSRHGHLSNADSLDLLKGLCHDDLEAVVFAHLSEVNNHPNLVIESSRELRHLPEWERVRFEIAGQNQVTPGIELT